MRTLPKTKAKTAATKSPSSEPDRELLELILDSLDDDKAEGVVVIDLTDKSNIADFMVVASGRSSRQVVTMAEHLGELLKPRLKVAPSMEGLSHGDWVLVDAGDVIVHLFRPEVRSFYNLEKMWGVTLQEPAAVALPA